MSVSKAIMTLAVHRYAFEALLDNEFHEAEGFFFTPYAQKGIPKVRVPRERTRHLHFL